MPLLLLALIGLPLGLRGCPSSREPIHLNPNMDVQPRYDAQGPSAFFYNGAVTQTPVAGTVARGELNPDVEYQTGRSVWGSDLERIPIPVDTALLARGKARYQIYCTPCHGRHGDGQSVLRSRVGVRSANLREERIRRMPDGRIFQIIRNGSGLMPSYRYPIATRDRWAIVAHVRGLQQEGAR